MYADEEQLFELFGVELSDAARGKPKFAERCAICDTPPAPRGLHHPERLRAWIEVFAERLGRPFTRNVSPERPSIVDRPGKIELTEDETRCLPCDSHLSAAVGIPDVVLATLLPRLSDVLREFVVEDLVYGICDVCRHSPHAERETADTLMDRYYRVVLQDNAVEVERARQGRAGSLHALLAQEMLLRAS